MLEYPIHLDIESTNMCQLKCGMCPRIKMKRKVGYMEWEVLKKIIDEVRDKGVRTSYLHQIGEPLFHKGIVNMINYVADAGIQTSISTNCLLLNDDMGKELLNSKLDELTLCIDSLNKETYEKMRAGSNFNDVMWNVTSFLQQAKGHKLKVTIQMIKTKYNIDEVEEWTEYFKYKAKNVNYNILAKEFSTFSNTVKDIGFKTPELRFRCNKVNTTMTINWNGDIVLCCRDYDSFTVIGNVKNNTLKEIWDGEIYTELRERFKNKDFPDFCKKC